VLGSLIAYLRGALPRLDGGATVAQELDLVRAYLEVMELRMPDRLNFRLEAEAAAAPLACPPMALLTLVENAVRHGLDPSEEGGRIWVRVMVRDGFCRTVVEDTGVGLEAQGGTGTGLARLRERLALGFGPAASLALRPREGGGVLAELVFPARRSEP
jgi:sensor histidine kinase YesM